MKKKELHESFEKAFAEAIECADKMDALNIIGRWAEENFKDERVKVDEIVRREIFERWKRGEVQADIAREMGLSSLWIRKILGVGRGELKFSDGSEVHPVTGKRVVGGRYSI